MEIFGLDDDDDEDDDVDGRDGCWSWSERFTTFKQKYGSQNEGVLGTERW